MKHRNAKILVLAVGAVALLALYPAVAQAEAAADWALNATAIESCSCPMFCTCYFSDHPAAAAGGHGEHGEGHFCRFNMAYKVNSGHHGDVDLAGAKFWIAGDLGDNFGDGKTDWAILTFDPAVTPEQRAGIAAALPHVFPVEWESFGMGEDAAIHWEASDAGAVAKLDDGKAGEIVLTNAVNSNQDAPVVIDNLKYWGVPRNEGFVLMPNEINAWRLGDKAFETRDTNGFMITIDMNSGDVAPAEAAAAGK